jgi:hypothetical protein
MTVSVSLSHVTPFEGTAFLIKNKDVYALYLGDDTGRIILKKQQFKITMDRNRSP